MNRSIDSHPRRAVTSVVRGIAPAVVACAIVATAARAITVNPNLWVPNGAVTSSIVSGSTLYIGGGFTWVGPAVGCAVPLDATTGALPASFPRVGGGTVYAIAADGDGGWFLGGTFTSVGGQPRHSLAHVLSDGSVAAWNPGADNSVYALAANATTVYVGGYFATLGGQTRHNLGAVSATTGAATAFDPEPTAGVLALQLSGNVLYAGGDFTYVGFWARNHVVAMETGSGFVYP